MSHNVKATESSAQMSHKVNLIEYFSISVAGRIMDDINNVHC
jgi:hypothetical protein